MPSFLDELKNKRDVAIEEHQVELQVELNEEKKFLSCKDAIIGRFIQYYVKYAIEEIKERLIKKMQEDPTAIEVSVKYQYPSLPGDSHWKYGDIVDIFREFGFAFPSFDYYKYNKMLGKLGFYESTIYCLEHATVPSVGGLFSRIMFEAESRATLFKDPTYRMSALGEKCIKALKVAAASEGINIEYKNTLSYDNQNLQFASPEKIEKKKTYLVASVKL